MKKLFLALALALGNSACVLAHSRQALPANTQDPPPPQSVFVSEEDSGLLIGGFIQIAEADHYAVLLSRMRERYRCKRLTYPQLDYYTDHWLIVAFPIARITAICEQEDPQAAVVKSDAHP